MDYYRKKLKPSKSPSNENITDIHEIENKWADMQPKIHECTGDKSKVQKQLAEIKTYIEYCQSIEEKVSEDQQERIKQITRKCKEVLVKFQDDNDVNNSGIKSPRTTRKNIFMETSNEQVVPQNKVALVEVEEKLKSMRQRRLDRLSVFVAEQSKLSEERSNKSNEIENAIKSIQQSGVEKKSNFNPIIEENVIDKYGTNDINIKRHSSDSTDKSKTSSTKKFINKFNCGTTQTTGSSNEDLTKENDDRKTSHSKYSKPTDIKLEPVPQVRDEKQDYSKIHITKSRNSFPKDKETTESKNKSADRYNPLLSPVGKQRRAVYLYENECKFLENERESSLFGLREFGGDSKQEKFLKKFDASPKGKISHIYENRDIIAKNESEKRVLTTFGKTNVENVGKRHVYESRVLIDKNYIDKSQRAEEFVKNDDQDADKRIHVEAKDKIGILHENKGIFFKNESVKSQYVLATFGNNNDKKDVSEKFSVQSKPTLGLLCESKNVIAKTAETIKCQSISEMVNSNNECKDSGKVCDMHGNEKPKKSNSLPKFFLKNEAKAHRQSDENFHTSRSPLRSPLPLPRKSNHGERVLKKLQRNWESLNEIIENDSDVDCDEIEDLKKTWEEANTLLCQYKARLDKLKRNPKDDKKIEKLSEIKKQLENVGESVKNFRGLKRDSSYKQLSSRLSNYFLVISQINCSKAEALNEKKVLVSDIEKYIKLLENKVNRNEAILLDILEAQVNTIGTKYLNSNKV